jgi:hypothetical protein
MGFTARFLRPRIGGLPRLAARPAGLPKCRNETCRSDTISKLVTSSDSLAEDRPFPPGRVTIDGRLVSPPDQRPFS